MLPANPHTLPRMTKHYDALILVAHGARDARWMEPFFAMQKDVQRRLPATKVGLAFMEFATPTFADATAELAKGGARNVLVVPIFLSGGGHVAKDIPELVDPERARHPELRFAIAGAIGEEPEVKQGMLDAIGRLVAG
jgi:sirohydrochlorin cobaltochelatase